MRPGGSSEDLLRPQRMILESRRQDTLQGLRAAAAVGVVRHSDGVRAARIARALVEGGLQAIEITATTPDVFETIEGLVRDYPAVVVGVGTVRTVAHLEAAAAANAQFAVSPHTDTALIAAARRMGLVSIPGALTPTEIVTATDAGADFVKVFPISAMGGPPYLRWLRGPLPNVSLWVSGQVAIAEIADYLAAGAELVGLTSALTADLPDDELQAAARLRVAQTLQAVADFRHGAPLLTLQGERTVEVDLNALRDRPDPEHASLETLVAGRRGQAVWLRELLRSAGIPAEGAARVVSLDGFARTVETQVLYDGGLVHFATDGHTVSRDQGGPLRLYIVRGTDQCDNIKGLNRIETIRSA